MRRRLRRGVRGMCEASLIQVMETVTGGSLAKAGTKKWAGRREGGALSIEVVLVHFHESRSIIV